MRNKMITDNTNDFGTNYGITVADFRCLGIIYGLPLQTSEFVGNRNGPCSVWSGEGSGTSTAIPVIRIKKSPTSTTISTKIMSDPKKVSCSVSKYFREEKGAQTQTFESWGSST